MNPSVSGSGSSVGSTVFGVWTHYADSTCSGSPLYMELVPHAPCYDDLRMTDGGCLSSSTSDGSDYYYRAHCSTDVVDSISSIFETDEYVGFSVYGDAKCSEYGSTAVTAATGECQPGLNNGSVIATVADGSTSTQSFATADCTGNPSADVDSTSYDWATAPCTASIAGDSSYEFFTAATIDLVLPPSLASVAAGTSASSAASSDSYWSSDPSGSYWSSDPSNFDDGSSGSSDASQYKRTAVRICLAASAFLAAWLSV